MSILGNFFGDKELTNIEKSIDDIFNTIGKYNSPYNDDIKNKSDVNLSEMFQDNDDITKILENVVVPPERLLRYQTYEELVRTAPFIKRILRVYQPYILQKNPVSGQSIIIKPVSENDETVPENDDLFKQAYVELNKFIKHFDYIKLLKTKIIPNTVLYGDCFVEIVDKVSESEKIDLNKIMVMTESEINILEKKVSSVTGYGNYFEQVIDILAENIVNMSGDTNTISEKKSNIIANEDVLLKIHKPHKIIILETEHGTRLGYLEVFKDDVGQPANIAHTLSSIIGRLTHNVAAGKSKVDDIIHKLIQTILKKILKETNTENADVNTVLQNLNPDIYKFIKNIVVEKGIYNKVEKIHQIKVRFISLNKMQQFSLPLTTEYLPYGTSLFDPVVLPCKLYILSQLGNIITKLSRAPAIRKWTIDQGTSQMSGQLIQKLKRELNNSRITVEDLSSWRSIPKILSDYKDLYLLSKQGNKSLDVEVTSLGDPSVKVQDLQDSRSEIIALSGIPAPYLGFNEVIELREQLVHANVTFATEIADIQESINDSTKELVNKIFLLTNPNNSNIDKLATISLTPPTVLILQLIEMTMASVTNILNTFQSLQIPMDPYFLLQQYIPYINWNKFKDAGIKFNLKKDTTPPPQQDGGNMRY